MSQTIVIIKLVTGILYCAQRIILYLYIMSLNNSTKKKSTHFWKTGFYYLCP